jgi:predicted dehydrogenase
MRPRLGFLGVGWIGRNRMEVLGAADVADVVAVADPNAAAAAAAAAWSGATVVAPDALLDNQLLLDGVVIATPTALHASQSLRALGAGAAVFCQKPLGRTAHECAEVVAAARCADRLLGVDLSYRHLSAIQPVRTIIATGSVCDVYAVDLVFHNAYGPDRSWSSDPALAGGGCVIDLGIHLIDLGLWILGWPEVTAVTSRLYASGRPLPADSGEVEDFAIGLIDLRGGATMTATCSWFGHTGADAEIALTFRGTDGSVGVHNVGGSFYDFESSLNRGASQEILVKPPDPWGGRALVEWADRLGKGQGFDPAGEELVTVGKVLDRMYGR